jgi:hypothetical protein
MLLEGIPNVAKQDNNNNFFSPEGNKIKPYLLYFRNNLAFEPADRTNKPLVKGLFSILKIGEPVQIFRNIEN